MSREKDREMLAQELEDVALVLAEYCMEYQPWERKSAEDGLFIHTLDAELDRLQVTCEMLGFSAFSTVLAWEQDNAKLLEPSADTWSARFWDEELVYHWLELAASYLLSTDEADMMVAIREALQHEAWIVPLPDSTLKDLLMELCLDVSCQTAPDVKDDAAPEVHTREPTYPLDWDNEVHPELLQAFFQETPAKATALAKLLRDLMGKDADAASTPDKKKEQYEEAARLAHTLKGDSSVIGLEVVSRFTHRLEDILEASRKKPLPRAIQSDLYSAADCLESLFSALQGDCDPPSNYPEIQQNLDRWWQEQSSPQAQTQAQTQAQVQPPEPSSPTPETPKSSKNRSPRNRPLQKPVTSKRPTVTPMQHIPVSTINHLLEMVEEMSATTGRLFAQLEQATTSQNEVIFEEQRAWNRMAVLENLLDQMICSNGVDQNTAEQQASLVDNHQFDNLEMDDYNEIHGEYNALAESLADARERSRNVTLALQEVGHLLHEQNRLNRKLNQSVLGTRLVSVKTLIPRLERIIRETCRNTGKQARLQVSGDELALDMDILRGLTDPLLHLLRNAIDHGIETPEERQQQGKPEEGCIFLDFGREENQVYIQLGDDGRGMDTEKILLQARERQLVAMDDNPDQETLLKLVLQPGFSTRESVSNISGRGVGMDIVCAGIEKMQGSLQLESEKGRGFRIHIHLPLTLVSLHALIIRCGQHYFAIPNDNVQKLIYLEHSDLSQTNNQWHVSYRNRSYPIEHLSQLLGLPGGEDLSPDGATALLVHDRRNQASTDESHVFQVDEVLYNREVVVKGMTSYLSAVPAVSGTCILLDGSIAPVLDLFRLLDFKEDDFDLERYQASFPTHELAQNKPEVLIVDDSLSNRKALSLMVEQLNLMPVTAIDGLDALQHIDHNLPALILADLEMPRMNGLDLTQTLRGRSDTMNIPIVMITSRSTRKHRHEANRAGIDAYLTKPVDHDTLSQCIRDFIPDCEEEQPYLVSQM